jgi:hypothetical protein
MFLIPSFFSSFLSPFCTYSPFSIKPIMCNIIMLFFYFSTYFINITIFLYCSSIFILQYFSSAEVFLRFHFIFSFKGIGDQIFVNFKYREIVYSKNEEGKAFVHPNCNSSERKRSSLIPPIFVFAPPLSARVFGGNGYDSSGAMGF